MLGQPVLCSGIFFITYLTALEADVCFSSRLSLLLMLTTWSLIQV